MSKSDNALLDRIRQIVGNNCDSKSDINEVKTSNEHLNTVFITDPEYRISGQTLKMNRPDQIYSSLKVTLR